MDFLFPNRQRLEGVVVFLAFVAQSLGPAARTERVGELRDGEDAFAAEFLAFFSAHCGQQTEVILFDCFLPAASMEFTLGTMPVQDQIGWGRVGQQCGNSIQSLSHFAGQAKCFHLQRGRIVAMSDFAEADSASEYFGEHKRIERQQQLFVLAEFVGVHKTDGDELG